MTGCSQHPPKRIVFYPHMTVVDGDRLAPGLMDWLESHEFPRGPDVKAEGVTVVLRSPDGLSELTTLDNVGLKIRGVVAPRLFEVSGTSGVATTPAEIRKVSRAFEAHGLKCAAQQIAATREEADSPRGECYDQLKSSDASTVRCETGGFPNITITVSGACRSLGNERVLVVYFSYRGDWDWEWLPENERRARRQP